MPRVYLVPLHAAPELMNALASYYRERLPVDVVIHGNMQVDTASFNAERHQLIAERAIAMLRAAHPIDGKSNAVIGVTSWDMYIQHRPWLFALSSRDPPYAIVSYARMDPVRLGNVPNPDRLLSRLRKMVSRNIGVMLFQLPLNAERSSLLYQDVMGVDELDRLEEDLPAAGFPAPPR
jgi:predicted Zn-dependent protease